MFLMVNARQLAQLARISANVMNGAPTRRRNAFPLSVCATNLFAFSGHEASASACIFARKGRKEGAKSAKVFAINEIQNSQR